MADDEYKLAIDYRPKGSGFGGPRFSGIEQLNKMYINAAAGPAVDITRRNKMSEERAEAIGNEVKYAMAGRVCQNCGKSISVDEFIARNRCRRCYKVWYRANKATMGKNAPKTAKREPEKETIIGSSGSVAIPVPVSEGKRPSFQIVIDLAEPYFDIFSAKDFLDNLKKFSTENLRTVEMQALNCIEECMQRWLRGGSR